MELRGVSGKQLLTYLGCKIGHQGKTIHEIHEQYTKKFRVISCCFVDRRVPPVPYHFVLYLLRSYHLNSGTTRVKTRQRDWQLAGDIYLSQQRAR